MNVREGAVQHARDVGLLRRRLQAVGGQAGVAHDARILEHQVHVLALGLERVEDALVREAG